MIKVKKIKMKSTHFKEINECEAQEKQRIQPTSTKEYPWKINLRNYSREDEY